MAIFMWCSEVSQRRLGILGLHTPGFFIDSAFESFRLNVALILIFASALLNIVVDSAGRILQQYLHLPRHRIINSLIS